MHEETEQNDCEQRTIPSVASFFRFAPNAATMQRAKVQGVVCSTLIDAQRHDERIECIIIKCERSEENRYAVQERNLGPRKDVHSSSILSSGFVNSNNVK